MSTSNTMGQTMLDIPSTFRKLYWPVAIILALLLAFLWLTGRGPGGSACAVSAPVVQAPVAVPAPPPPAPVVAAVAAPAPEPVKPAPAADIPPAQNFYFATNKFDVSKEGRDKAVVIIDYLKSHPNAKAMLSGYHDPRGDAAANEELALNRARAVRSFLEEAGINKDRVVMNKPAVTTGDGSLPEARRVELAVVP
jgi:outer membrane protein OmpA-like peptidoglycan-associated protein